MPRGVPLFYPKNTSVFLIIILCIFSLSKTDSKRADLKGISKQLKISRLSFAEEKELVGLLGLKPGEVTPFGLIKDIDNEVIVIVDNELEESNFVSFHPNVNTSTLTLKYDDFEKFLEWTGNTIIKLAV